MHVVEIAGNQIQGVASMHPAVQLVYKQCAFNSASDVWLVYNQYVSSQRPVCEVVCQSTEEWVQFASNVQPASVQLS